MDDFIGTYGNNLIVAVVGVGVALLILAIVLWIIRRRGGSSPFIRGGKNRQPRLQVLDATAVDTRRRLVLVRRDNVEHLVMIGGPTDIVIESGIGAIPILKDVRDPQSDMYPSLSSEKTIAQERARSLPQAKEEDFQVPVPATAAPSPQPVVKQSAVAPAAPQPRPAPTPTPAPMAARPSAPPVPSVTSAAPTPAPSSAPAQAPVRPTPLASPPVAEAPPRAVAREPVTPPVAATAVPVIAAAALQQEIPAKPTARQPQENTVAPAVAVERPTKPEPVEPVHPPVIDSDSAVDFLDAARDRVLPDFRPGAQANISVSSVKPEPLAPADNGPVFGDQLTSDFESFLEAEIAKNNAVSGTPTVNPEGKVEAEPAPSGDTAAERDVQKEMARIFGEMTVSRDR